MFLLHIGIATLIFIAFWCFTLTCLARLGGWSAIATRYRSANWPTGRSFRMQSVQFNWVDYNGGVTIHICPEGVGLSLWPILRFGHPSLLIPWSALHVVEVKERWYGRFVFMNVDEPAIARIRLPLKVMETARGFAKAGRMATEISEANPD